MIKPQADMLFEISWEVCNKVGGIWTVISSKADQIRKFYNENYICIGPYFPEKILGDFEEKPIPPEYKNINEDLKNQGIIIHFGKWLIKGEPTTILIDFKNFLYKTDEIKKELWDKYKIDSLSSNYSDYNDPLVWGKAAGILLEMLAKQLKEKKIVAQFHEWLTGSALLHIKSNNVNMGTVFTTHATVMGRALAASNFDLFTKTDSSDKCNLELIDVDEKAYELHTEGKHLIEKVSADNSDIFTTVSEITAFEANCIIKRKPEVILCNGLDNEKFPTFEEASIKHRDYREVIRKFVLFYFSPFYKFDIKDTLFFFIAGRYELRNKGIDIYIKALAKLNDTLKKQNSKKTIIAFIFVPADIWSIKQDVLENRTMFNDIKESIKSELSNIKNNILYTVSSNQKLVEENIFDSSFLEEIKRKVMKFSKKGVPPVTTHNLKDGNDSILKLLMESGLDNLEDDKVKAVLYPVYLTGADSLLDLTYYQTMQGCHLGIFPSFYEPWGYTPLEAAALGVSSVTTDLAGFGKFIQKIKRQEKHPGIFVLERMNKHDDEIIDDLSKFMMTFINFSKQERVQNKIEAKRLASLADWKILTNNYIEAHNKSLEKRNS